MMIPICVNKNVLMENLKNKYQILPQLNVLIVTKNVLLVLEKMKINVNNVLVIIFSIEINVWKVAPMELLYNSTLL
jgi:hypothetical protein